MKYPGNNTSSEWGRFAQQFRAYERTDPLARLFAKVRKDPSGCWIYTGKATKNGYPVISVGKNGCLYGHRLVYERRKGPIPHGKRVHHTCENKLCLRPSHLKLKTARSHARAHGFGHGPCRRCGSSDWYIRKDTKTRQCRECRRRRRNACG